MRKIGIVSHPAKPKAKVVKEQLRQALEKYGLETLEVKVSRAVGAHEAEGKKGAGSTLLELGGAASENAVELLVVLGGDGTILRALSHAYEHDIPVLGINLGHVGFLAEGEEKSLQYIVEQIVSKNYQIEERLTIDVRVELPRGEVVETWAANEVALLRGSSDEVSTTEIVLGVDNQPVFSYAGDGVIVATPTGSTAYSYSAGGPMIWPDVEAMTVVPLAAHALFSRPLVVSPSSQIEILVRSWGGITVADGFRKFTTPPSSKILASRGKKNIKLARIYRMPFAERLVAKFNLPVKSWKSLGEASD